MNASLAFGLFSMDLVLCWLAVFWKKIRIAQPKPNLSWSNKLHQSCPRLFWTSEGLQNARNLLYDTVFEILFEVWTKLLGSSPRIPWQHRPKNCIPCQKYHVRNTKSKFHYNSMSERNIYSSNLLDYIKKVYIN